MTAVTKSKNSEYIFTGSESGRVRKWNQSLKQTVTINDIKDSTVTHVELSHTEKTIAVGYQNGGVSLLYANNSKATCLQEVPSYKATAAASSTMAGRYRT